MAFRRAFLKRCPMRSGKTDGAGLPSQRIAPQHLGCDQRQAGAIRGVARIYNRFEYIDERRAALDKWSRHVANVVLPGDKTQGNVVAFMVNPKM